MHDQSNILSIRFTGDGISPNSFTAKELGELLIDLQKGMSAIARLYGDKEWSDSDKILSLIDVENRSNSLCFASFYPEAADGYGLMIRAANEKNLSGLPRGAYDGMKRISKLTKRKQCNAELSSEQSGSKYAVISPDDTLMIPEEVWMTDTKDFYGKVTRVGGSEPKVRFKTFGGKLFDGTATESLAKKIAGMLYQTVKLQTEIKWIPSSTEIEEIKILNVEAFEVRSNTELFDDLKDSLGGFSNKYGSDMEGFIND